MELCPVVDKFAKIYLIARTDYSLVSFTTCHANSLSDTCIAAHILRELKGIKRESCSQLQYFPIIPNSSGDILEIEGEKTQRSYGSIPGRGLV